MAPKTAAATLENELPYSLYTVKRSEENKHAGTVFIHCTDSGRYFATDEKGFCNSGEILLAEWDGDKLGALYKVEVVGTVVKVLKCIKGSGSLSKASLSEVTDRR